MKVKREIFTLESQIKREEGDTNTERRRERGAEESKRRRERGWRRRRGGDVRRHHRRQESVQGELHIGAGSDFWRHVPDGGLPQVHPRLPHVRQPTNSQVRFGLFFFFGGRAVERGFLAHLAMPMSLYDHHLSLSSLVLLLLASVSVDSLPSNFQNGCSWYKCLHLEAIDRKHIQLQWPLVVACLISKILSSQCGIFPNRYRHLWYPIFSTIFKMPNELRSTRTYFLDVTLVSFRYSSGHVICTTNSEDKSNVQV